MGFFYAGLWFMVACVLFFRFRKESFAVPLLSLYFLFLGAWWLADQFMEADLLHGGYAWVLRGISAAALLLCGAVYYYDRRRATENEEKE